MGSNRTRTFRSGGSIGRAPDNDWMLPDPEKFVSGQHALITVEHGRYVLVDRSTNGTLVNGRELPRGGRVELESGDLLTIGNYEIRVSVDGAAAADVVPPAPSYAQPFDALPADSGLIPGAEGSVDPLDFFADPADAGRAPAQSTPSAGAVPDHASPGSEFFAPPNVRREAAPAAAAAAPADVIPENWDETSFTAPDPLAPAGTAAETTGTMRALRRSPSSPSPGASAIPSLSSSAAPTPSRSSGVNPSASPGTTPGASPGTTPGTSPTSGAGPSAHADVDALLRAAGIDPAAVDAGTAASLGEILRVAVEGVMDVLRARAEIKNQFRVPTTTLKPVENNPLKFSVDANDALFNLFARRGPSFKAPGEAFREAFDDLRAHQIAMMAGMRAAFGALLARFDPDRLQEGFDRGLKRAAILDVINKTKYWDLYRETYAELGNDDATFRRLFGDEFAQAYEEQMQRLTALRSRK